MNLHEIIHTYLRMDPVVGRQWLLELVHEAGLNPDLVKHIQNCEQERITRLIEG